MKSAYARGFTLIELIVAIGLASIVLTTMLIFFTTFVGHQVRVQDERSALETVRFLFSEISRETYFGHDYTCGQTTGSVCNCLAFTDQSNARVKIWYDSANKQVRRARKLFDPNPNICSSSDEWVPFTDNAVSVTKLSFELENDITKQPRIQAQIDAEYIISGETKPISFKTQITSRILEPDQNILNTFVAGSENENTASVNHYAYGPRVNESGRYLDENGSVVTDSKDAEVVCRDRLGSTFVDSFCEEGAKIVAAELTDDGLYVLGDNGLLFFIPQAAIEEALAVSGSVGEKSPIYKTSSKIQDAVVRVVGAQGPLTSRESCRFCANDPRNIISIHPTPHSLYAKANNGALYLIEGALATSILEGGISRNTVRHIDSDVNQVLVYFRDADGNRIVRLFTGSTQVFANTLLARDCREFAYVPGTSARNSRCRQIHPDPDQNNNNNIEPSEIRGISFRFLDTLQVINRTASFWYRDSSGKHLVSVGGTRKLRRSDAIASGSIFAYGNGLNAYTTICSNGTALCAIDTIDDTTPTIIATNSTAPLIDHLHFRGLPIAINKDGRLIYFSGIRASDTATVISVFNKNETPNNKQRILCDTTVENDQQVTFKHLTDKRRSLYEVAPGFQGNIAVAVGTSLIAGYVDEIYLIEPTTARKKQYSGTELNTVCSDTDHIERYHLPTTAGPSGGLDIVRLHGVEFRDKRPGS